jgi:NAD(P)-dependent dehydrogenase (short-subunit alcohol dehydrogenase family)
VNAPVLDTSSLFDLSGKSALVIGGTGTLGRAGALALAASGCRMTIADKGAARLAAVATELREAGGDAHEVATIEAWSDSEADAEAIVDAAVRAHGALDLMFVALGWNDVAFIESQPFETWRKVIDANLNSYWLACQAAGRHFAQRPADRGRAKVVMVSSTRGRHGLPSGYTAYCASKSGLEGMVRALGCEWAGKNANANAIGPTVFRSPVSEWMFSDEDPGRSVRATMLARIPFGRLSEAEDLVGTILYLLAPASDYMTGQTLYVDGGYTAD